MDYSLPGFSIHGIFQAKVLEWGAIAFSESSCMHAYKSKIKINNYSLMPLKKKKALAFGYLGVILGSIAYRCCGTS